MDALQKTKPESLNDMDLNYLGKKKKRAIFPIHCRIE